MSDFEQELECLRRKLKALDADSMNRRVLIGFDGFVDEVIHVVKKRYDKTHFDRIEYLKDYGMMITDSAGLSLNVEMVPVRKKLGGNGPICANTLAHLGAKVTYIGACGFPEVASEFKELSEKADILSIARPACTEAIEFRDGKIISSRLENLNEITWEKLTEKIGVENIVSYIEKSDIISFANWTMVMSMSDIWEHLLHEILPKAELSHRPKLFIDLADPSKRFVKDVRHALELLEEFENYFEVILGLNKKEAKLIHGIISGNQTEDDMDILVRKLKSELKISKIVIHTADRACAAYKAEVQEIVCPYCSNPVQTTGAGDNFNAGYVFGEILGVSLKEALMLGTASAGYYIRNAKSAVLESIEMFLEIWKEEGTGF